MRPDPELTTAALDMSRPELAPLADRYFKPTALVVGHRPTNEREVEKEFRAHGWTTLTCSGPASGTCPVLRGQRCALREVADVAVVGLEQVGNRIDAGSLPRLRCAADASSPSVVVLEHRNDAAKVAGRYASVGRGRGTAKVVELAQELRRAFE